MKFIKGLMARKRGPEEAEFEDEIEEEVLESQFDRILAQKQHSSEDVASDDDWDDDEDWGEDDWGEDDWAEDEVEDDFAEADEADEEPAPAAMTPRRPARVEASGEVDLVALGNLLKAETRPRPQAAPEPAAVAEDDQDDWDDLDFDDDDFAEDDRAQDGWDDGDDDDTGFDDDAGDDDFAPEPQAPAARSGGRKIWDLDQVEDDHLRAGTDDGAEDADEDEAPAPVAAAAPRPAGRVKTRLLGFQQASVTPDIFGANQGAAPGQTMFPVGWIVVLEGPGRGACFTLTSGVAQIGRGDDQTIRLDFGDTSISRQNHAAIAFDEELNQFFLGHGGKSNLVRLNDRPVLSTEQISDGDLVRIGETTLRFIALCGEGFTWREDQGDDLNYAAAT